MEGRGGGGREEQNSMTRNSGEGREGVMALFCRASIVYLASVCLCLCVQLFSLQINLCWLAIHHIQENVCHQNEVITD